MSGQAQRERADFAHASGHCLHESSGTTETCCFCGAVRFTAGTQGETWSRWYPKDRAWGDFGTSVAFAPRCRLGQVPWWVQEKHNRAVDADPSLGERAQRHYETLERNLAEWRRANP